MPLSALPAAEKSTLVNLVPRFYGATEGRVTVGGVDVREYAQLALHNKIGYVPQKTVLFNGTVRANGAYGDGNDGEYSEDAVQIAVVISQSADFVAHIENGLDAEIAQYGANVSGGQKQRLSIARAVCRKPEIYFFDDSFSALDFGTDHALRTALRRETAGGTSLIVAQRVSENLRSSHHSTVHHIVRNPAYTGILRSGESFSEPFEHLQIIPAETFQRAEKEADLRRECHVKGKQ